MERIKSLSPWLHASVFVLFFAFAQVARADFIGVYAGAGTWNHTTSGTFNYLGTNTDLEQDLGFKDDFSGFFYLAVEHPFPLIPNVRISKYTVGTDASRTVTAATQFTFNSTPYVAGDAISTALQWDESDALLYYEILDNIVSLDLGLGVKNIDGDISVTSGGTKNTLSISETVPIAYFMVGAMIPGTGVSVSVDTTKTFAGDNDIVETSTKISYETEFMLGVEAGYRTSTVNLDGVTNVTGELKFTGPFANLLFHF